jgi:hypothetical protein
MPVRKKTSLSKRLNQRVLDEMRETIASGAPWEKGGGNRGQGFFDVFGLVSGSFFDFGLRYCQQHDEESQKALWQELRQEILAEHIKRQPGTRPWGWWKFDAPQMRRVIGVDKDTVGEESGLPAFEDPSLPGHFKENYFGRPNVCDGFVYETEGAYLARLKLLTAEEKRTRQS